LQASRHDQKLEFILRTAARIFAEKSYHSTSMRDISRATNVSLAGLYHYCRSKEELLFLIQDNCFGRVLERLEQQRSRCEIASVHREPPLVFRGEHGGDESVVARI
jgi:AcrR family transcriptional regulator